MFAGLILALCATAQSNDGDKIYRMADPGITPAVAQLRTDPEYTKPAQKEKIQGTVGLNVVIEKNGKIEKVKVVRSLDPGLDESAIKGVKEWEFTPCKKDGKPVRCAVYLEITFHLY